MKSAEELDEAIVQSLRVRFPMCVGPLSGELVRVALSMQREHLKDIDPSEINDRQHPLKELRDFRRLYNTINEWALGKKYPVYKSKHNFLGEAYFEPQGGHFIVVAKLPMRRVTDYYEMHVWDQFVCEQREKADQIDDQDADSVSSALQILILQQQGRV